MFTIILYFILFLFTWYIIIPVFCTITKYLVLVPLLSKRKELRKAGDWAIVTGATDGIGKAFAEQLAKDGFKIFLISRTQQKLEAVKAEIEKNYKVESKIFRADFCSNDFYENLNNEISALSSIACLVNNVGISLSLPDYYSSSSELSLAKIQDMINCNIASVAKMTRLCLAKMESQKLSNLSPPLIINISSFSGYVPLPLLTLYASSKAFVLSFSNAIAAETNFVRVKTVMPNFVSTAMTMNRRPSTFVPSANTYVTSVMNTIGVEASGAGYLPHAMFEIAVLALPDCIRNKVLISKLLNVRTRTLRKLERQGKKST